MTLEQIILLALIQGITEFLPISSSAHLNLVHLLTPLPDQGAVMDVAVHVGSLAAVMIYFRHDVADLFMGLVDLARGRFTARARVLVLLAAATVPIFAAGLAMVKLELVDSVRTVAVIAWANLIFAVPLYLADRFCRLDRKMGDMSWRDAILVGLAQVFSVLPGASRSGVTMTMARFLGYQRTEAARFSMLLSIPTILGLGLATAVEVAGSGDAMLQADAVIGAFLSFAAALVSIAAMMALLRRTDMLAFVIYRVVLGVVLLAVLYAG